MEEKQEIATTTKETPPEVVTSDSRSILPLKRHHSKTAATFLGDMVLSKKKAPATSTAVTESSKSTFKLLGQKQQPNRNATENKGLKTPSSGNRKNYSTTVADSTETVKASDFDDIIMEEFSFGETSTFSNKTRSPLSDLLVGEDAPKWARLMVKQLEQHANQLNQLEAVLNENAKLRSALKQANSRISMLEGKNPASKLGDRFNFSVPEDHLKKLGTQASKYSDANFPQAKSTRAKESTVDNNVNKDKAPKTKKVPSFADITKQQVPTKHKFRSVTAKQRKTAARIFEAPVNRELSGSGSYKYLYLPNKYRDRLKAFRDKLKKLGIDNGRILDINYPARGVVALLIHQNYEVEIVDIFQKFKIDPIPDFNPKSTDHLTDPALAELDTDTRTSKAVEFHQNRLIKAIGYIRKYLRRSVARDFISQGWISDDQARQALADGDIKDNSRMEAQIEKNKTIKPNSSFVRKHQSGAQQSGSRTTTTPVTRSAKDQRHMDKIDQAMLDDEHLAKIFGGSTEVIDLMEEDTDTTIQSGSTQQQKQTTTPLAGSGETSPQH